MAVRASDEAAVYWRGLNGGALSAAGAPRVRAGHRRRAMSPGWLASGPAGKQQPRPGCLAGVRPRRRA